MNLIGISELGNNQVDQKYKVKHQEAIEVDICDPVAHFGALHRRIVVVFYTCAE